MFFCWEVTEKREWIPMKDFITEFEHLGLSHDDVSEVVEILDGPSLRRSDKMISWADTLCMKLEKLIWQVSRQIDLG